MLNWIRAALFAALLWSACGLVWAQTSALPGTTPPPTTGEGNPDDEVAPPPTATATLPAQAKRSSLMIKRGDLEVEWRLSYSHFSKSTLFIDGVAMLPVLVVGEVAIERTRRDLFISSLAGHYGILDNLQGELKVPFRYQLDRNAVPDASPPKEKTISGFGLGDIEGALYYQLPHKSPEKVRWVTNIGIKSATGRDIFEIDTNDDVPLGTGFWSTKVGITGVKIADPAAVYWSFGYTYNWERRNIRVVTEDQTTGDPVVSYVNIKPGNTFDIGAGVAFALNPTLSMNTGFSVSYNQATTSNGSEVANTAITSASLRFGAVWLTERKFPVDLSVGIGLTDDSPDFTLEYRQNFTF